MIILDLHSQGYYYEVGGEQIAGSSYQCPHYVTLSLSLSSSASSDHNTDLITHKMSGRVWRCEMLVDRETGARVWTPCTVTLFRLVTIVTPLKEHQGP